jgi:predicted PurR-regulated permease PerM
VLKWLYFVVVTAFLAAVLWMLNDMRLRVIPVVDRLDRQLPPILDNTEQAAQKINTQLPEILKNSEVAVNALKKHLPELLAKAQQGVNQLGRLANRLQKFQNFLSGPAPAPGDGGGLRVAANP